MAYRLDIPKDLRSIVRAALDQGWTLSQGRMGHPKLTSPEGHHVAIPTSTRRVRTIRSIHVQLRKLGVND